MTTMLPFTQSDVYRDTFKDKDRPYPPRVVMEAVMTVIAPDRPDLWHRNGEIDTAPTIDGVRFRCLEADNVYHATQVIGIALSVDSPFYRGRQERRSVRFRWERNTYLLDMDKVQAKFNELKVTAKRWAKEQEESAARKEAQVNHEKQLYARMAPAASGDGLKLNRTTDGYAYYLTVRLNTADQIVEVYEIVKTIRKGGSSDG